MKTLAYMLLVLLVSVVFSSVDVGSYSILERTLPAVLGACLGGVLACASIIISVLSGSSKKTKAKAKDSHHFMSFISSLEHDVKILVACLFFTVMLPYLRSLNYPMTLSLFDINRKRS